MKKIILTMCVLCLFFVPICYSNEIKPKLFIMLNVDNTMVDRVDPDDIESINELSKQGYIIQKLEFNVTRQQAPKFSGLYAQLAAGNKNTKESEYMTRIKVEKVANEYFHITEYIVVRPSLQVFLENIKNLGITTHILVCSRNDDVRTKNLVDNLNLYVNNKKFKDLVDFVPRNSFRVKIKQDGGCEEISAKSAVELRKQYSGKYGPISKDDYVVLVDKLEDYRFIASNSDKDLNVKIDSFVVLKHRKFNRANDHLKMNLAVQRIKQLIFRGIQNP